MTLRPMKRRSKWRENVSYIQQTDNNHHDATRRCEEHYDNMMDIILNIMLIHGNGHSHIFVDDHGQTVQPMAGKKLI